LLRKRHLRDFHNVILSITQQTATPHFPIVCGQAVTALSYHAVISIMTQLHVRAAQIATGIIRIIPARIIVILTVLDATIPTTAPP